MTPEAKNEQVFFHITSVKMQTYAAG
ncbi:hypothetical protein FXF61_14495 [Pseudomonas sp. C27(2019)]|nr:hypothetical protein FXF61_14495 [Pseudomonas sp. C27(2019)]